MSAILREPTCPLWLDDNGPDFYIDTALSWDGGFPPMDEGDYLVTIDTFDGERRVLVSRRYTEPLDADDAARIALDAVSERYGVEDPWLSAVEPIAPVEHHGYRYGSDYGTTGCVEVVRCLRLWHTRPCFPGCLSDGEWTDGDVSEEHAIAAAFDLD